jgi:hypothetical protein
MFSIHDQCPTFSSVTGAGYPAKILYDFCRTAARNLERAGVRRTAAMQMVGHKTEAIYRRYGSQDVKTLREASAEQQQWADEERAMARQAKAQVKRFNTRAELKLARSHSPVRDTRCSGRHGFLADSHDGFEIHRHGHRKRVSRCRFHGSDPILHTLLVLDRKLADIEHERGVIDSTVIDTSIGRWLRKREPAVPTGKPDVRTTFVQDLTPHRVPLFSGDQVIRKVLVAPIDVQHFSGSSVR